MTRPPKRDIGGLTAQVGWLGLRVGATRRSVCIHQMNRVNSRSDRGPEDSTINIVIDYYYYYGRPMCNRADHYIFALWFLLLLLSFFPRRISAVADWMSTILLHMVWP